MSEGGKMDHAYHIQFLQHTVGIIFIQHTVHITCITLLQNCKLKNCLFIQQKIKSIFY